MVAALAQALSAPSAGAGTSLAGGIVLGAAFAAYSAVIALFSRAESAAAGDALGDHRCRRHADLCALGAYALLGDMRIAAGAAVAVAAVESYFGIYLVGNRVAAQLYAKHPALMIPNEQGVPEPPQRVHWDNAFTQRLLGLPGAYDLGPERCSWLIQGMTNWIGDNAYLTRLEARYLKFNYMGDVTWVQGEVTDKFERDGKGYVRCELECVNHRDEVTATAVAEAELAQRK